MRLAAIASAERERAGAPLEPMAARELEAAGLPHRLGEWTGLPAGQGLSLAEGVRLAGELDAADRPSG